MAAKQRWGYTSPHYNHSLQKGSEWRITGIFRLLLSKTELSAALTPFLIGGNKQLTDNMWTKTRNNRGDIVKYGMRICEQFYFSTIVALK